MASCAAKGHSGQPAGLPGKRSAFWEQEAAVYHQETQGRGRGGAQAVPELAGRVGLFGWTVLSVVCPLLRVVEVQGPARPPGSKPVRPSSCCGGRSASPLRERGSQDLPVSPQPFLSSQPPPQPPQSRPPHLLCQATTPAPTPHCCQTGLHGSVTIPGSELNSFGCQQNKILGLVVARRVFEV